MDKQRLLNKVVVITGATKGIGRGIAFMVAQEGAQVVISGRNVQQGETVVAEIEHQYATEAHFVPGDISDVSMCKQLIDEAVERFGRIDGLVNNAGIFPRLTSEYGRIEV
jgi:NAD(P)-dependent dehydrogenase (short-subunit alcohol dehydrogenase family)